MAEMVQKEPKETLRLPPLSRVSGGKPSCSATQLVAKENGFPAIPYHIRRGMSRSGTESVVKLLATRLPCRRCLATHDI